MINDATEKTLLCDLPAGDLSGFQFWIALDYSQSGLFNAGNKTNYFLTKISLLFLSPLSAARVAGSIIETGTGIPLQHLMLRRTYCKQTSFQNHKIGITRHFSCRCPSTQRCLFWTTRSAYSVHIFQCQPEESRNVPFPLEHSRR